ncbi:MAG: anti-sigma factor antagonist RssC [Pseudomonas sp.]
MTTGRIQFAESDGTFVLKFLGDVRLTLCAALDAYIEKIFSAMDFKSIVIDLTETENIDSTSLGLLAKLSILSRERAGLLPTLVSTQEDMLRLLQSMGFEQIFNIVAETTPTDAELQELPAQMLSEEQVRSQVLEAHRLLMDLNDHNRNAFVDLVSSLQSDAETDEER